MRSVQFHALADEIRRIEGGFGNPLQRPHRPTAIDALDARLPGGGVAMGAVHELIAGDEGAGLRTLAAHLARQAAADGGYVIWVDTARDFYPPAALSQGLRADRLVLLRPADRQEALW